MTSAAQVLANRSNARKSTGPRTPEGKAAASQNAVKHGLLAEQVVIKGEDPEEFDLYRAGMLAELAPVGAVEALLAERAVSLAWRLRRAERLQSAVFATVYRENANDIVLWPKHGLPIQPGPDEDEVVLGQVVMTDFLHAKVLDRLLVYERRIESSLYRTMRELRREREARAAAVEPEGVLRSKGSPPAGQEPAAPAKLASFGADVAPEGVSRVEGVRDHACALPVGSSCGGDARFGQRLRGGVSSSGCVGRASAPTARSAAARRATLAATDTSLATATANPAATGNHGRDARATGTPAGVATNDEGRATPSPAETLHASRFTIDPAKRTQLEGSCRCEVSSVKTGKPVVGTSNFTLPIQTRPKAGRAKRQFAPRLPGGSVVCVYLGWPVRLPGGGRRGNVGTVKKGWHVVHGMTLMTRKGLSVAAVATMLLIASVAGYVPAGEPNHAGDYFAIQVVDRQTGRGVPLVELRTTNLIRHFTDSHGFVAFHEPGLMDREVFFFVESHGYSFPKDGFGSQGLRLRTTRGTTAVVKVDRVNVAERLYRVTGQGIYRDSVLLGRPVPLKKPVLNGQVMGQDSVFTCLYRGRLFWMWGDTGKPSYPLGNFAMSGAVSDLPGRGGLDPSVGVDLEYFVGEDGFSRKMAPLKEPGMVWLDALMTVPDRQGNERMVAKFTRLKDLSEVLERGLMVFNDATNTFEPTVRPGVEFLPYRNTGHAFPVTVAGRPYHYFTSPSPMGARLRVRAEWDAIVDANQYEVLTALTEDRSESRLQAAQDRVTAGLQTIHPVPGVLSSEPRWVKFSHILASRDNDKTAAIEALEAEAKDVRVWDVESGREIIPHNGTVYFNAWRQRWIGIFGQLYGEPSAVGEIWYAEADTPVGPWTYARKVMTHHKYSFYNPKHHLLFDQDGGRTIYLEGTYTWTFSGTEEGATPRYDYNQIMYRLNLADPRLVLPIPVYQVQDEQGGHTILLGDAVAEGNRWDDVESVIFYAVEPGRGTDGTIPVYADRLPDGSTRLRIEPPETSTKPLFHALAGTGRTDENPSVVPLHTYRHSGGGYRYSIDPRLPDEGWTREATPLCWVWRVPPGPVLLDRGVKPDR